MKNTKTSSSYCHVLIAFELQMPYALEALSVLARPYGMRTRFRYRKKWFDILDPKEIRGRSCLISLRRGDAKLVPLRFGTVDLVQDIGGIFYIEVSLKNFYSYFYAKDNRKVIDEFNQEIFRGPLKEIKNPRNGKMEKLIFFLPVSSFFSLGDRGVFDQTKDDQIQNWSRIIEVLSGLKIFKNTDFVFITDFSEDGGVGSKKDVKIDSNSFVVKPNRSYALSLLQRRARVSPQSLITVKTDENIFAPILDKQFAIGRYDSLRFVIASKESADWERQSVIVFNQESSAGRRNSFLPLIFDVKMKRKNRATKIFATICFGCCVALLLIPELQNTITTKIQIDPSGSSGERIRNIIIIVLIISGRGTFSLASSILSKFYVIP